MAEFQGEFLKTKDMDIGKWIPEGVLKLREPSRRVMFELKKEGKGDDEMSTNAFIKHAPGIVFDHNVNKDSVKMETKLLLDSLFESFSFTSDFIEEVMGFFPSKKESKSS